MLKSSEIRLHVVRAAKTQWDATGRCCGGSELPCDDASLAERAAVTDAIAPATLVLHGDEDCSRQTASLLSSGLASVHSVRTKQIEGIEEFRFGLWEGMHVDQLKEKFPTALAQWNDDPSSVIVPQGELLTDAQARIVSSLAHACAKTRETDIVVVLRPIAAALTLCWLNTKPISALWDQQASLDVVAGPFTLDRAHLRTIRSHTWAHSA